MGARVQRSGPTYKHFDKCIRLVSTMVRSCAGAFLAHVVLAVIITGTHDVTACDDRCRFDNWCSETQGALCVDVEYSFEAFKNTLRRLEMRDAKHLQGHGISGFATMSPSQFQRRLGYRPTDFRSKNLEQALQAMGSAAELQYPFDWRYNTTIGSVLTSVKNQVAPIRITTIRVVQPRIRVCSTLKHSLCHEFRDAMCERNCFCFFV